MTIDDRRGAEFQLFPNRRISWEAAANEWSALLEARRASGEPLLDLTVSNPTAAGLGEWDAALREAFASIPSFLYRPSPEGAPEAREAIAAWYASREARARSVDITPDSILLTASSSESYSFLFQALCDPGDGVLAPLPSYPLFEYLAGLSAVRLSHYRLRYQGEWQLDFGSLAEAVTPRTRAVVVVNPNNPTGSFLSVAEKQHLLAFCAARNLTLIADEVFEEYPLSPGTAAAVAGPGIACFAEPQSQAVCVSLGGLSKTAGLPQMKLGWMILGGPEPARLLLRERLLLIADTYLSVSTPVQMALPKLLDTGRAIGDAIRLRTRANLAVLHECARAAPHLTVLPVQAGWNAVLRVPAIRTDAEWCASLLGRVGVLVQPGFFYDFEGEAWLVLSLLTPPAVFREGVARLCAEVEAAVGQAATGPPPASPFVSL